VVVERGRRAAGPGRRGRRARPDRTTRATRARRSRRPAGSASRPASSARRTSPRRSWMGRPGPQGRVGLLCDASVALAWAAWHLGDWGLTRAAAEEPARLEMEAERPASAASGRLAQAALQPSTVTPAPLRRSRATSSGPSSRCAPPRAGDGRVRSWPGGPGRRPARRRAGRTVRLFDARDVAGGTFIDAGAVTLLADAAAHSGRHDDAIAIVDAADGAAERSRSRRGWPASPTREPSSLTTIAPARCSRPRSTRGSTAGPSTTRGCSWHTVRGCGATSRPRVTHPVATRSTLSARCRGRTVPAGSRGRRATAVGGRRHPRRPSSPRRSSRSRRSRPAASPTARSAGSCSSRPGPSARTCTASSPSSV
jgi:hypothetical protein